MKRPDEKINEIKNNILEDIENNSIIMFYLDPEGRITVISSGNLSKCQIKVAERMLSSIEPSIILSIVLKIEILLVKFQEFLYRLFAKK